MRAVACLSRITHVWCIRSPSSVLERNEGSSPRPQERRHDVRRSVPEDDGTVRSRQDESLGVTMRSARISRRRTPTYILAGVWAPVGEPGAHLEDGFLQLGVHTLRAKAFRRLQILLVTCSLPATDSWSFTRHMSHTTALRRTDTRETCPDDRRSTSRIDTNQSPRMDRPRRCIGALHWYYPYDPPTEGVRWGDATEAQSPGGTDQMDGPRETSSPSAAAETRDGISSSDGVEA